MTDDDAFLQAVVAAPGDDAPRLVYADWLDERGDPRGAYLRAEIAWAQGDRTAGHDHLIRVGELLDPIWVARITRPPAGVCCDKVHFRDVEPSPSLSELAEAERALRVAFPPELKALLLNYHGGRPTPALFPQTIDVAAFVEELDLLSRTDPARRHFSLVANVKDVRQGGLSDDLVLFATVGPMSSRFLTVSTRHEDRGCVDYFAWLGEMYETIPRQRLASSIGQFLTLLTHDPNMTS